ncbi:EpsG family protein [Clostridium perfringens]|nr:EpsG family protein [Clostridium perfringens]EGT3600236.1 EpsG family protein [Clostridium perfringens]MDK0538030.1 EpsG family protein [Clostridium perfringens]MDM0454603.1 EpsG family protein [Clostridium perfringens]
MYLYYFFIIYIFLCALIIYSKKNKLKLSEKNNIYLFLNFSMFIFISAFRGRNIGNDTCKYLDLFNKIRFKSIIELKDRYEIGYLYLNKMLSLISDNQQIILIVTSCIILICYAYFIKKYSANVWLSVFLFFILGYFTSSMNTIRHQIALGLVLISYKYIKENKFFKFLILILVASTFHSTSIIFLISYPISKLKINFRNIMMFFLFAILGYALFDKIFSFILLGTKYEYYLKTDYLNGDVRLATVVNILIISTVLLFGIISSNNIKKSRDYNIMCLFLFTSLSISIISLKFNLLDRVADYFQVCIIVYLPNVISKISNQKKRIIAIYLVIVMFFLYGISIQYLKPEWNKVFPYSFFWN